MSDQTSTEPHLIVDGIVDGCRFMPPIEGAAPGSQCRVAESTVTDGPHIHLLAQDMRVNGVARVHITVEDALRLADQIQLLAASHYQLPAGKPAPLAEISDYERNIERLNDETMKAYSQARPANTQLGWYQRRVKALESLLACYRAGSRPSEKLHHELEVTRERIGHDGRWLAASGPGKDTNHDH